MSKLSNFFYYVIIMKYIYVLRFVDSFQVDLGDFQGFIFFLINMDEESEFFFVIVIKVVLLYQVK